MTNTVLYPSGTWVNSDGLQVRFGTVSAKDAVTGKATVYGDDQEIIVDVDWHDLPAFQTNESFGVIGGGLSDCFVPAGALVKGAVMTITEGFVGATATLSVGLVCADGTELDNDGLIDAATVSSMSTVGNVTTGAGALIGTILSTTATDASGKTQGGYYPWLTVQTATFTAGKGRLKITYFMPTTNTPGGVPA